MAADIGIVEEASPTSKVRAKDLGGSPAVKVQMVEVAPWMPIVVAGGEYNQTVGASAFTLTVPATATHALLSIDGGTVRMREDGTAPTATSGILLPDGFIGELPLPNPLKLILASGTPKLNVTYRKYV